MSLSRANSRLVRLTHSRAFATSRILTAAPEKESRISANYTRPPVPKSRAGTKLPVFPLIFIFVAGTLSFGYLTKSRQGQGSSYYVLPTRDNEKTREELYKKST